MFAQYTQTWPLTLSMRWYYAQAAGMGGSAEMISWYATKFLEAIAHIRHNEHGATTKWRLSC